MGFNNSIMWNPWHGCHRKSEGCVHCYMYSQDKGYGIDSSKITISKTQFNVPIQRDKYCDYKIPSGTLIKTCMTSDFFIEEADAYRQQALDIIEERQDLDFLIITKRPERIRDTINKKYKNIILAITCENQTRFNERLNILNQIDLNIFKTILIFASPILEEINLANLSNIQQFISGVYVGGENYNGARPCRFEWVQNMSIQTKQLNIPFTFWDIGSNFIKDNKQYNIKDAKIRMEQAIKSNLSHN